MSFEVTFLLIFLIYHQNLSVIKKSVILFWLVKFACFNVAAKFSDVNLLNFEVVIYMSRLEILLSTYQIFVFKVFNIWYFVGHLPLLYLSLFNQCYTDPI